jgi:hypothetical protein
MFVLGFPANSDRPVMPAKSTFGNPDSFFIKLLGILAPNIPFFMIEFSSELQDYLHY